MHTGSLRGAASTSPGPCRRLLILGAAAWQVFFVQWNTEEIAYERYLDINNKQKSIWVMLEPDIWDITNHPSGTKAEPDLQKSLTRWYDLNTRWIMAPLARNPEYYYMGGFKGIQFTIFILGSILVVIGKVLIDEVNPLAPNPSAQATTIAHREPRRRACATAR
jgi:hypothetical protein